MNNNPNNYYSRCILRIQSFNNLNSCQSPSKNSTYNIICCSQYIYNLNVCTCVIYSDNNTSKRWTVLRCVIWTVSVIAPTNVVLKRKQLFSRNVSVHDLRRFCGKIIRNRLLMIIIIIILLLYTILYFIFKQIWN